MKRSLICVMVLLLSLMIGQAFAQSARRAQIEVYGGAAFPLAPDEFKDYYKVGLSGHGQYVIFPSPRVGISLTAGYERFTVDNDALQEVFAEAFELEAGAPPSVFGVELDVEGRASIVEVGVGVRPYLTRPETSTQFFLFGMGTFNFLSDKGKATAIVPGIASQTFEEEFGGDEQKFGLAGGAGIEAPAGESANIVIQGIFRFIFTEDETTNFLGVTAGLVF